MVHQRIRRNWCVTNTRNIIIKYTTVILQRNCWCYTQKCEWVSDLLITIQIRHTSIMLTLWKITTGIVRSQMRVQSSADDGVSNTYTAQHTSHQKERLHAKHWRGVCIFVQVEIRGTVVPIIWLGRGVGRYLLSKLKSVVPKLKDDTQNL